MGIRMSIDYSKIVLAILSSQERFPSNILIQLLTDSIDHNWHPKSLPPKSFKTEHSKV